MPKTTGCRRGGARPALPSLLLQNLAHLSIFIAPPSHTHTHPTHLFSQIIHLCGKPGLKISPAWKNSNGGRGGGQVSGRLFRERSQAKGGKEDIDVSTDVFFMDPAWTETNNLIFTIYVRLFQHPPLSFGYHNFKITFQYHMCVFMRTAVLT